MKLPPPEDLAQYIGPEHAEDVLAGRYFLLNYDAACICNDALMTLCAMWERDFTAEQLLKHEPYQATRAVAVHLWKRIDSKQHLVKQH